MLTSLNILIIEDDASLSIVMRDFFHNECDHEVTVTPSSREAFYLLEYSDKKFDVILLDYHLPDGTGLDFFAKLLTSPHRETPVIMITGERSREVLIEFMKMGGADFIQKPVRDIYVLDTIVRHTVQIARSEKYLKELEAEKLVAIEAKKFMEDFIAKLCHEMGTPLHHLKSGVNIALKELASGNVEKAVDWLSLANKSNLRMTRLVNDISDLSRLQRGKLSIHKRLSNIEEIVLGAKTESLQAQKGYDGQIVINVPQIPVICDPERISQVFINLLNNTFNHAIGATKVTVDVKERNQTLLCRVTDDGQGLPADQIQKIFKPFEQCSNAYNSSGTLGVGLSISNELVKLHGGEIRALPNDPKGMIFEFYIPLERGIHNEFAC